jgi:hypothetical protein
MSNTNYYSSFILDELNPNFGKDLDSVYHYLTNILENINFPSYIIPEVTSKYLIGLDKLKKKMYREKLFGHIKIHEKKFYNLRELHVNELVEIATRELDQSDVLYAYESTINLSVSIENNQFYIVWIYNKNLIKYSDFNMIRLSISKHKLTEFKVIDNFRNKDRGNDPLFAFYIKGPIFKLRSVISYLSFHIIEFNQILTSRSMPNALHADDYTTSLYFNPVSFVEMNNYPPRILEKKSLLLAIKEIMFVVERYVDDLAVANIIIVPETKYHRVFDELIISGMNFSLGSYILLDFNPKTFEWRIKIAIPKDSEDLFFSFDEFKKKVVEWIS